LKTLGGVVTTAVGIAALVRIWQVFPFDFDDSTHRLDADYTNRAFRVDHSDLAKCTRQIYCLAVDHDGTAQVKAWSERRSQGGASAMGHHRGFLPCWVMLVMLGIADHTDIVAMRRYCGA